MSLNLQYLMMISFLFDPYNVFFITSNKSKPLLIKSKLKSTLYNFKRFYKSHFVSFLIFSIVSLIMCFNNVELVYYFLYLSFLPLIIPHTNHFIQIFYLLLSPLVLCILNLHSFLPLLFIFNFLIFYHQTPRKINFHSEPKTLKAARLALPLIFIIWFILENYSHSLFQQVLIVAMFMMVMSLESNLTETKSLLDASKNRYILWQLKEPSFNMRFLNKKCRHALYQQLFMLTYLSILISLITKDYFILVIILLASIYLLLSEFDKMIQHKFFNQSILYDDFISRFVFSQIILSGLSFYLLYLGLGEVMVLHNLHFPYFNTIKYGFIIWYGVWILFFFKRFNKKISINFLKISLVICLLSLSACSNKDIETFTVIEDTITFTGNMVHLDKQEFMIQEEDNITLEVSHGDMVKKGDVLYSLYDTSSGNEIKRLNFQIEQITKQVNDLNAKIKKEEDKLIKADYQHQVSDLKNEIELLQFDKNLISTSETYTAKFNGQVYLKDGLLQVFSNQLVLNLELNEHEYRNFNEFNHFEIMTLDHKTITESKDFIIHFLEDAYIVTFDLFEHDCYVNQTLLIKPKTALLFVPETYVRKDDKKLLVQTESTEVIIKANYDELKKGYYIKKGIKEGDVLYPYEKNDTN